MIGGLLLMENFFTRGLANIDQESNFGHITLIFEFPSKEDTVPSYESDEYQR